MYEQSQLTFIHRKGDDRISRKSVKAYDFPIAFQAVIERILWPQEGQSSDGWARVALNVDMDAKALNEAKEPIIHPGNGTVTLSQLLDLNEYGNIVATGTLAHLAEGISVFLLGYVTKSKYGQQIEVVECYPIEPDNLEGVEAVVGSGIITGVREVMASRIVQTYGMKTYPILDGRLDIVTGKEYSFGDDGSLERAIKALVPISGISERKARSIHEDWLEHRAVADLIAFLSIYNVSTKLALRIYKDLGAGAVAKIMDDPWSITKVRGIGFTIADMMARAMGVEPDSPKRIQAGLREALRLAEGDGGHVFLWDDQLVNQAMALFEAVDKGRGPVIDEGMIRDQLEVSIEGGDIVTEIIEEGEVADFRIACYQPWAHQAEKRAATEISRLMRRTSRALMRLRSYDDHQWSDFIRSAEITNGFAYSEEQREAIKTMLTNKVSCLTGGAGTGKSTVTRDVIRLAEAAGLTVFLAAPSGKAAKRAAEATGHDASTIHRLLEASGYNRFAKGADNQLTADLVIIDEVSMVDIYLLAALASAVKDEGHLILIGDPNQLPSVGPGLVLRHLLDTESIPVARLGQIYRQSGVDNLIIANSQAVLRGDYHLKSRDIANPTINEAGEQVNDFYLFKVGDAVKAQAVAVRLVTETIPQRFGVKPDDIQVLAPQKRGPGGVNELNIALQAVLNPPGPKKAEIVQPKRTFRIGDRLIMTRNDYEKEVFNGDGCTLVDYSKHDETWYVRMDDDGRQIGFTRTEMGDLLQAWALTIHKSQGSEYDVVVVLALSAHYNMLYRALLYTALSRGRQTVILITSDQALGRACRNNPEAQRNSLLRERLEQRLR